MTGRNGKQTTLWIALIALTAAVALPSVALGQGRGRGRGNSGDKCDKFVNCHDARDGRVDGRGPRTDRDYDDDDDYDYGRSRRSRNRRSDDDDYYRNGGGSNRNDIARQAVDYGYREGFRAGRDDRRDGRGYSYDDHNTYRDATAGYRSVYGDRDLYRRYFQEGYRRGYEDGYRNRSASGTGRSRVRDILGDILGRP